MEKNKSKISNTEWGLLIGALFMVDAVQVFLDWTTIGFAIIFINPFIDIFVGMALPFYLKMRGEKLASGKKIGGFVLNFLLKLIPGLDELPLWGLDGLFQMALSKSDKILEAVPGGKMLDTVAK